MSRTILQHSACPRGNGNPDLGATWHRAAFPRQAVPSGQYQTEQAKKTSDGHPSQGRSQSRPKPEGEQQGEANKENGGETGHPHIHGGAPTPALPTSRSGAVAQSKREQNNAGKGE